MPQRRVLIASVLKPVDDPRMYEKMALSLSQTNKYEINIIGFTAKNLPQVQGIKFHKLGQFTRLSLQRFLAPWRAWRHAYQLKPSLLIICSHELLLPGLCLKILTGCSLIYDVQENYWRNILYGQGFPLLLRPLVATWVRGQELLSRLWVDRYILAEAAYYKEMPFLPSNSLVLPNKYVPPAQSAVNPPPIAQPKASGLRILISGTLSAVYGTLEALSLANNVSNQVPELEWHIIGYAPDPAYARKIRQLAANKPHIKLEGIDHFVPHQEIVAAIEAADVAYIPYIPNRSTENCLPSRFYEYAWHRLPMIYPPNALWRNFMEQYEAGFCLLSPSPTQFVGLLEQLRTQDFYSKHQTAAFEWSAEAPKFNHLIDQLS